MQENGTKRKALSRVDVQVSLLAACMVVLSSVCIFTIAYHYTYTDMILSLTDRVDSIYQYLEDTLDQETFFVVNTKEDMDKQCYREMKELFYNIKQSTGVQYLYTAKQARDGTLVYVIDGLDYAADDFRYPGDPIEVEIIPALERALNNELVLPKDIKRTPWGDIFIAYLPIHNQENEVMGVIGIEFEANHQYATYQRLRQLIPLVILVVCILSGVAALVLFRRLSNPHYQDLANTDSLTGLKNRNAYELDISNLAAKGLAKGTGLLLADLNGLKKVNDTLGHEAGDLYICTMAKALRAVQQGCEVLYRVGGDEFVVLIANATQEGLETFAASLEEMFQQHSGELMPNNSFAIGWAICEDSEGDALGQTYRAADDAMYAAKHAHYAAAAGRR